MAKVRADDNLNGETPELEGATEKAPFIASIVKVELIAAEDLPEQFENRDSDRWQLTVDVSGDELKWMPNKTSLKTIIAAYGNESDLWSGKKIGIYLVDQAVKGKMKKVPYCKVPSEVAA